MSYKSMQSIQKMIEVDYLKTKTYEEINEIIRLKNEENKKLEARVKELESDWIRVKDKMPPMGQKVILFLNNGVQQETYELDQGDGDYGGDYFWYRDDLDECPLVDFEKDLWMPLPEPRKTTEAGE